MAQETIRLIFGAYPMNTYTTEQSKEFLSVLKSHGVKDIDTAAAYLDSEKLLGDLGAPKDFIIHTKARAFVPGSLARKPLISGALLSFWDLKVEQVDVYFLHSPDSETPLEETLAAVQELYEAGKFKRFGLSNFLPDQVQQAHDICKSKGYVLPTVYQGNYNPVARRIEADLFPVLRKLDMAFYAYSPLAGGFLTKTAEAITAGIDGGRFDKESFIGKVYHALYNKPTLVAALEKWEKIAKDAGVSQAALAYRWVAFNSQLSKKYGDGIIIGASRPAQLEETLKGIEHGPLPAKVAEAIDEIWPTVKDEAPLDNFNYEKET